MINNMNKINRRTQLIGAIFVLLFFAMIYRFYELQAVEASFYQQEAEKAWNRETTLQATRGTIYDRTGKILAQEAQAYIAVAILSKEAPNHIEDPVQTAKTLAPIINMSEEQLIETLTQEGRYQVELRPKGGYKLDYKTKQEIEELELPGITFIEETKRYYPNQNLASHVIGFVNSEGDPVMGLEASLDQELRGIDGSISFKKDAQNKRLPDGINSVIHPLDGKNVYLTIDQQIQLYMEQALDEVEKEYRPESMTAIVSNPHTGEILAMGSRPSFNPNQYANIENYMNHAISSTFEPGSTFKIITLAAAIEEGLYRDEETYLSGSYTKVPGGEIRDHNQGVGWGQITFLEGVQRSSNVAFTILGWERMAKETFYHYIHKFGFGEVTGIDLPFEHKGIVKRPENAYPMDVATMTFGQGVAVTAIQQIAAINAIANGGKLIKPYMIQRMESSDGKEVVFENKTEITDEQVVSEQTAKKVGDILETVVTEGTGKNFYIDGYNVVGKTGTAQKVGEDGNYSEGEYIYSFIGYAPKDNPELVVYVSVDSPQVEHYSLGGAVVAQVFKPIMQNSLQYMQVTPKVNEEQVEELEIKGEPLPDYHQLSVMAARQKAEAKGLEVTVIGDGTSVSGQSPAPETTIFEGNRLFLMADPTTKTVVPDFSDWSLREVKEWALLANVNVETTGEGFVNSQNRAAGSSLTEGSLIRVDLAPKNEYDAE